MSQAEETTPVPSTHVERPPEHDVHQRRRSLGSPLVWLAAVIAVLVLVVVAIGGIALGRSSKSTTTQGTITVSGSGTIQGTPNTVSFNVGVRSVRPTAQEALAINNIRVANLEAKLEAHGVLKKDLQTSDVSIYEMTDRYGNVTGFSVSDSLSVSYPYSNHAGTIVDVAARATGSGITFGGVSLSISNESVYLASARGRAMHNAQAVANQDARGGGTALGRILRVSDEENTSPIRSFAYPESALNAATAGVPIEAGRQPVSVQVTVTYALDD